jgi:hypothetical protein
VVEKPNKLSDFAFVDDGDEIAEDTADEADIDTKSPEDNMYDKFL